MTPTATSTTTTTTYPDPNCSDLCDGIEDLTYLSDGCCTPKYCLCSGGQGYVQSCNPPGTLFCADEGGCIAEDECKSREECCSSEIPSTSTTTTTTSTTTTSTTTTEMSVDCTVLCADHEAGESAGGCCSQLYCQCSGAGEGNLTQCDDGEYFCTTFGECQDMFGQECAADLFGCCSEETSSPSSTQTTSTTTTPGPSTSGPVVDWTGLKPP